ncbi:hypothetical protein EI555_018278, partial [Monodon monoceros]
MLWPPGCLGNSWASGRAMVTDDGKEPCNLPQLFHSLTAEENLGMVMISTLVTAVQEKLNEMADQIKTIREEEKKQKEKEVEAAEKQLFHGTPVTIENSVSWKAKFDVELLEIK